MAIALVNHIGAQSADTQSCSTTNIDTTASNFIGGCLAFYTGASGTPVFGDNQGNTYSILTVQNNGRSVGQIVYCENPTVSSTHSFNCTTITNAYPSLCAAAFSGVATSSFDQQNGANSAAATSLATGSIIPGFNNELILAGFTFDGGIDPVSIDSGFTITDKFDNPAITTGFGSALAYIIQTTAVSVNPTLTGTGPGTPFSSMTAEIASFKAVAGSPPPQSGNIVLWAQAVM